MRKIFTVAITIALTVLAWAEEAPLEIQEAVAVEFPEHIDEVATAMSPVLELAEVHAQVLQANPTLKAAHLRVQQALERIKQARSLWYPQAQVNFDATHTELSDATMEELELSLSAGAAAGGGAPGMPGAGSLGGFLDDDSDSYSLSFRAAYILFDGFSRRFSVMMAKYGGQESEALRLEFERQLLNAATNTYYGVQLARENVSIAKADMEFNERLLKDAQARRRAGVGSLSDELNFEVQIRAAQGRLIRAEREYENARTSLAALMGLPQAHLPEDVLLAPLADESEGLLQAPELEAFLADALVMRPDLQQRQLALLRSEAAVKREQSSWYPQINAFASLDAKRSDDSRFGADDFSNTVGVSVSYDLFTGGRNRAEIAEKKYANAEAEELLAELELQVASEVRQELLNLHAALEQLTLQEEAAALVARNRELVEKEYDAGQVSLTRLTQAQRDLIAAEVEYAVARVALRQAWHNLYTASGRPLQELQVLGGNTGL